MSEKVEKAEDGGKGIVIDSEALIYRRMPLCFILFR